MKKHLTMLSAALLLSGPAQANWSKLSNDDYIYIVGTFEPSLESPVYTTIEYHCGSSNKNQAISVRLEEIESLLDEPSKRKEFDQHLKYPMVIFDFNGHDQYSVRGFIDELLPRTIFLGATDLVANEVAQFVKVQILSGNSLQLSVQTLHGFFHTDIDTSGFGNVYREVCQ